MSGGSNGGSTLLRPKFSIRIVNQRSSLKIHSSDFVFRSATMQQIRCHRPAICISPSLARRKRNILGGWRRVKISRSRPRSVDIEALQAIEQRGGGAGGGGGGGGRGRRNRDIPRVAGAVIPRFVDVAVGIDVSYSGMCRLYQWQW